MATKLPANKNAVKNLLTTQLSLLDTVTDFLTVATHHILYLRRVYPPVSFLSTRAYNYPVRQNRHPDVCKWIEDAIAAVRDQMQKNRIRTVSICIFECDNNEVLEKWTFDLRNFPSVVRRDWYVPFESINDEDLRSKMTVTDLEHSFRATFSRLDTVSGKMRPLPNGDGAPECSFTITIELREGQKKPLDRRQERERQWIVAEPGPFEDDLFHDMAEGDLPEESRKPAGSTESKGKTHAIRRLEAGELMMEMFVEESDAKLKLPNKFRSLKERAAEMSFGAGSEQLPPEDEVFDPEEGYDLGEPEIHRKPASGAF